MQDFNFIFYKIIKSGGMTILVHCLSMAHFTLFALPGYVFTKNIHLEIMLNATYLSLRVWYKMVPSYLK